MPYRILQSMELTGLDFLLILIVMNTANKIEFVLFTQGNCRFLTKTKSVQSPYLVTIQSQTGLLCLQSYLQLVYKRFLGFVHIFLFGCMLWVSTWHRSTRLQPENNCIWSPLPHQHSLYFDLGPSLLLFRSKTHHLFPTPTHSIPSPSITAFCHVHSSSCRRHPSCSRH